VYGGAVSVRVATSAQFAADPGPAHLVDATDGLRGRLVAVRHLAADGGRPALTLDPSDGPPAAVVTAAVEAGVAVIVLPEGEPLDGTLARDVRRAADITQALLVERGVR
jgi:hypothetical protein